ncbi:MAG: hypothetical protein ABI790_14625 [Betaproteobacteria bacterium]
MTRFITPSTRLSFFAEKFGVQFWRGKTFAHLAVATLFIAAPAFAAQLEFDEYVQRAQAAVSRGDWESAASQYAQAINHPDLPRDTATRSTVNLEYGRAIGVLCHYGEAEKYLLRAREMVDKANASAFAALIELGAISVAQKKYAEAVGYFSPLLPLIERESRTKSSPRVVADAYEKFALALAATGKTADAESYKRAAAQIRATVPQAVAPGAITPYGTQCPPS